MEATTSQHIWVREEWRPNVNFNVFNVRKVTVRVRVLGRCRSLLCAKCRDATCTLILMCLPPQLRQALQLQAFLKNRLGWSWWPRNQSHLDHQRCLSGHSSCRHACQWKSIEVTELITSGTLWTLVVDSYAFRWYKTWEGRRLSRWAWSNILSADYTNKVILWRWWLRTAPEGTV